MEFTLDLITAIYEEKDQTFKQQSINQAVLGNIKLTNKDLVSQYKAYKPVTFPYRFVQVFEQGSEMI